MPPRKRAASKPAAKPAEQQPAELFLEYLGPCDSVDVHVPGFTQLDVWVGETIKVPVELAGSLAGVEVLKDGTEREIPAWGFLALPDSWRVVNSPQIPAAKQEAAAAAAADTDLDEE